MTKPEPSRPAAFDLEAAADQAIATCGGEAREAVKALIVANGFLEAALPFVPSDDGVAAGEAVECFNPNRDEG
jgi:hypothetical protein